MEVDSGVGSGPQKLEQYSLYESIGDTRLLSKLRPCTVGGVQ